MKLSVGTRLRSAVCETEVIVVRAPDDDVDLTCGGEPMIPVDGDRQGIHDRRPGNQGAAQLGKRYGGDEFGFEVLVTRGGAGPLALGGAPLPIRAPKVLPSSD